MAEDVTGAMDPKRFWDLIAAACEKGGGEEQWYDGLIAELSRLHPDDILAFDQRFDLLTCAAYTTDLWGAAYLINGGASDDGFYYFRCWLVGKGKKVYEAALADPDSLADVVTPDDVAEAEIYSAAARAWQEVTGRPAEEFYAEQERLGLIRQPPLQGEDWDFDDAEEVLRRFPRLSQLYFEEAEGE